jgi:hypothetical protein
MYGGSHEIPLHFDFRQMRNGKMLPDLYPSQASFYEADIQVDAILGYRWMFQNRIGIFPHHNALAIDDPFTLLFGIPKSKEKDHETDDSYVTGITANSRCNLVASVPPPSRCPELIQSLHGGIRFVPEMVPL